MKLEDMKKEMPKTPEFIHTRIQDEVKAQMQKEEKIVTRKNLKKMKWGKVAAAAAICILGTSTLAYAGSKWYSVYVEKQGNYQVSTKLLADEQSKNVAIPAEIPEVKVQADYIPEGMEWIEENKLSYSDTPYVGGFSIIFTLLDSKDFESAQTDSNVIESEERTFGKYEGVYLKYHELSENGFFNQRIYLMCPDEYRMAVIYVGDDMSKEDAIQFAENLSLIETDKMVATKDMNTWSDFVSPEKEADEGEMVTKVSKDELKVWNVGDEFTICPEVSAEDENGKQVEGNLSVKVEDVQISDDLSSLDENKIPKEWKNAVGEDGKLIKNQLSYIKHGDGVESLDEVVKTEEVKQKLVKVTVTYKNNSEYTLNHILYLGNLMLLKTEDESYQLYTQEEQSQDGYDGIRFDGVASAMEMSYYSMQEDYGNGGNYIPSLKSGESVQVEMAWIVNENELPDLYLNLDGSGSCFEFADSTLQTGVVNIF